MRTKLIATAVAVGALTIPTPSAIAGDRDCSDFNSWRAAQKFYKRHGGPRYDPHRLDADNDGIACESLR